MPIIVLFFQENGLSMMEILLLQSIFSIGIILFEIPSGYFSDVMGRKNTIIIACILGFIGFLIYSFSYGFIGFLIAELMLGLGSSFLSGTDSAIVYDSLIQIKKEKEYKKIEGRMLSIGNFSEAIASFIGGFIALISLRTPFYFQAIALFLSIPFAFTLIEPKRKKYKNKEGPIKEIIKIIKYSLHHHGEVKWLIFYSGFIGASTLTMTWLIQPYLKLVGLPLAYFGIVWGIFNISVGIFSLYAYKIEMKFGKKKSLVSLIFIAVIGYILMGLFQSLWGILFIFLFYFVRGVSNPIFKDYVNRVISSDIRATVLSVKNLVVRFIFAIVGPFIGVLTDIYSLSFALLSSGGIFIICGTISLFFLHKNKGL
jgi:MFS family permease|tara:strand:- start:3 stop:1109 length:1107 start_codon:yes stop_codon:yes gene_type:complete